MYHWHITKVTDAMMKSAKTPGQGTIPGQPDVDESGVGKEGSMVERYRNINFLDGLYKGKEEYEKLIQESRLGSQPSSSNYVGFAPLNHGLGNLGGLNFKGQGLKN